MSAIITTRQTPSQRQLRSTLPSVPPDIFYQPIMQRPMFSPTRRPLAPAPKPVPVPVPVPEFVANPAPQTQSEVTILIPEDLILSGILGGNNNRSAFVSWSNGQGEWVQVDDNIDGWIVTEIDSEWITLTAGEDSFRLELFE